MIIYVYSKCSTCKKALDFLKEKKVSFTLKEIHLTPPSVEELNQMLKYQDGNLKKLMNTSGILYREMNLSQKLEKMTQEEVFDLLSSEGMLVKRPFLLSKNIGLVGFNLLQWSKQFP